MTPGQGSVAQPTQPGATAPGGSTTPASPGTTVNPPTSATPMTGTTITPPAGTAGSGSSGMNGMMPPGGAPTTTPTTGGTTTMPTAGGKLAMDECGLHTKFPGDEYCILPPPADKGFQLHIGPSNYDNPEPQYLLLAGQEDAPTFTAISGNKTNAYFYYRQYRMRPGAHHNIITSGSGGDVGLGQRIGTTNRLAEDNPTDGVMPPENEGVGVPIGANTTISVSLHSINTTQTTELREIWVNFWYVDKSKVTQPVQEVFSIALQQPNIAPGQDIMTEGSCTVTGTGRMLWMYGHRHANTNRFSTWRVRGGQRDLIYQGYSWEEPLVLEYASTVKNAVPDSPNPGIEGGWSGPLDIMPGDQIAWECHVVNTSMYTLNFSNNTYSGEMCILDAETIGTGCN